MLYNVVRHKSMAFRRAILITPGEEVCTWNPEDKVAAVQLSNGNLTVSSPTSSYGNVRGTVYYTTGMRYFEVVIDAGNTAGNSSFLGVADIDSQIYSGTAPKGYSDNDGWCISMYNGTICANSNGFASYYNTQFSVGDVVGVAVDFNRGYIWFSRNGVWLVDGDPANGDYPSATGISEAVAPYLSNGETYTKTAHFNIASFTYSPPTGFGAWGL